ncbi:MAG: TA system VapC family ribonuclease toxin [Lacipirellulaceae bacterium]
MTALLDANALLALGWSHHAHHAAVLDWLLARTGSPWATCIVTQSAFVRLSMNPVVINATVAAADALDLLRRLTAHADHRYLGTCQPLTDRAFESLAANLRGYRQVTDTALAYLAHHHGARVATLDAGFAATATGVVDVLSIKNR